MGSDSHLYPKWQNSTFEAVGDEFTSEVHKGLGEKGTFYFFASVRGRPRGRSVKLPFTIKAGWKDSKQ